MKFLIPHLEHEPRQGTWWRNAGKNFWGCPKCGQAHTLTPHRVNPEGIVSPSVVCSKCDFHDYVTLEEVSPEAVTH